MGFGGLELRARSAGCSVTEIGNRKERMRVREAGASAAGRGQRPYASFPDVIPKRVWDCSHAPAVRGVQLQSPFFLRFAAASRDVSE